MSEMLIPPIMHFIWIGKPIPDHLATNIEAWKNAHPSWQTTVWTEREIDEIGLQNRALYDRAAEIVPPDAVEQFRSDIVRYEVLALYGGFYADVDTKPLRPIGEALAGHQVFAAAEDRNWVGNTYLGAVPAHRIFHALIDGLPANVHRYRGKRPNKLSGPQYLTPIWRRHKGYVAETRLWYPYSYTHVKKGTVPSAFDDDVIAVHQWSHTQRVLDARSSAIRPRRQALQARVPFERI